MSACSFLEENSTSFPALKAAMMGVLLKVAYAVEFRPYPLHRIRRFTDVDAGV